MALKTVGFAITFVLLAMPSTEITCRNLLVYLEHYIHEDSC